MRVSRLILAVGALLVGVSACKNSTGPKEGETTISTLSCSGSGGTTACTIPLTGASNFEIELISSSCEARGNILKLVAPAEEVLTEDACYVPAGTKWKRAGPFSASASLNMSVTSKFFQDPPSLRVTPNSAQEWTIVFEDGYDKDFNDVIMKVRTNVP